LGDPATVTVTATNPGKASSTAYITGYALDSQPTGNAALYPQFGSVTRTADGFTVPISNYDPSYQWTTSPTSGISVTGTLNSGLLTVTGLAPGASLSVTVITTRNSYLSGFATITGTALAGTPSAGDLHFTVPEPHSYPAGTSVPMTAAGGVGTGRISFTTVTSGCRIRNNVLTVSSAPVDCAVTATKAASIGFPSSTITDSFHFDKVAQAALVVSGSSPTAAAGSTITLRASGGSGSGAVTFNVSGVSGSCSIT
jgi:titin